MSFFTLLVAAALGILTGVITGLTPGIHVNLVSALIVSLSPLLLSITSPLVLCIYIISLAVTQTFLDALPSVYLGAPDEAQALNVLPGHRLLLRGEGHNAIVYNTLGSLGCVLMGFILLPIFIFGMRLTYPFLKTIMGYLLLAIMIYMIAKEKKKWLYSLTAFLTAGTLGLIVLNIPTLKQPLFPLLSGLFGFSILLTSLLQKSIIPPQDANKPLTITNKNTVKAVTTATGMGFVSAFLPGFGGSQAAIVATNVVGDIGDEGFLTLVGGLNTANTMLSIVASYVLNKARSGAIVAVNDLIGSITFEMMMLFVGIALISAGCGAIAALRMSKTFSKYIIKVDYNKIIWSIIIFITLMTFYFDGFLGLLILFTSTAIGLVASSWGIGKNHLMGCLIVPVILGFLL